MAGNCPLELATLNARRVAALAGLEGVPIAAGAAGPLQGELVTAPDIHGETGLDGYELTTGEAPLDPRSAIELMVDMLGGPPEPVTLVPTGPLTNVAQLLTARPDLHERIREIVLMGGSTGRGNVTPAAEFNIFVDPEAAAIVFEQRAPADDDRAQPHPSGAGDDRGRSSACGRCPASRRARSRAGWRSSAAPTSACTASSRRRSTTRAPSRC